MNSGRLFDWRAAGARTESFDPSVHSAALRRHPTMPHVNAFPPRALTAVMPPLAGSLHGPAPRGMLQQLLEAEDDTAHHETVLSLVRTNGFDAMCYGHLHAQPQGGWSW